MPGESRRANARMNKVGILTFQWADNFGALLQVCGLKEWLSRQGFDTVVINYSPPFLRGREWLIPYRPANRWKKLDLRVGRKNIIVGKDRLLRKKRTNAFRRDYLLVNGIPIIRTKSLSNLEIDVLIVGSDQIWNPNITYGMCPAYFGAFHNDRIKKVISYGASFGRNILPAKYEEVFATLLPYVHAISMREKDAAEYVREKFQRDVTEVIDPVFLMPAEYWRSIQKSPKEEEYILYYTLEYHEELRKKADYLAKKKNLNVIELAYREHTLSTRPQAVFSAGPQEFLGYIDKAKCVFSDSFHALAFSILFHKPFYVCDGVCGARLKNLLTNCNLEDRMIAEDSEPVYDQKINWNEVECRLREKVNQSAEFLLGNMEVL